ncbi:MAG: ABC transporter ATP-binding protein [Candidatus Woesearchaeota archaeon]
MSDKIIDVKNLSKKFEKHYALKNISFNIENNGIYGILGPNGAGKTTLIKCLSGMLQPTDGEIFVDSMDVSKNEIEVRNKLGILPEKDSPTSYLTPREYLRMVGELRDIDDIDSKIEHWGKFLSYYKEMDFLIKNLSRGTKQKVMLSQTFIHEPKISLIDEPLVNLDPILQKKTNEYLKNYSKDNTILLSTHNLWIVSRICDKVFILKDAKLIDSIDLRKNYKKRGEEEIEEIMELLMSKIV